MSYNTVLTSVSFFCPAYNDEKNLPDLIPVVVDFLTKHSEKFEIVIIEDGSPDKTGEVADELAKKFPNIRVVHHEKNKGYTATLKEGFETAKYDYVMYTDGDNQYDVFDAAPYLSLLNDADVIAGYAIKKAVSPYRKFQSGIYNFLIMVLFFVNYKDVNCSLKIFKKHVLQNIKIKSSPYGAFIDGELVLKAKKQGYKIAQFPVTHYERKSGIASGTKPPLIWSTFADMIKLRLNIL
jgi:glycosyltransferase involved in cell wall biosynthesis